MSHVVLVVVVLDLLGSLKSKYPFGIFSFFLVSSVPAEPIPVIKRWIFVLIFSKTSLVEVGACSPPYNADPRIHLNGPFVSNRKLHKLLQTTRLKAVEVSLGNWHKAFKSSPF